MMQDNTGVKCHGRISTKYPELALTSAADTDNHDKLGKYFSICRLFHDALFSDSDYRVEWMD
jgi:hypothetical protein